MHILGNDTFATSDTHLGHRNIIKYCNRPFTSVEEMDEVLIEKWNKKVSTSSTIIHAGDVGWYRDKPHKFRETLGRLNGKKYLIPGNHDDNLLLLSEYFTILPLVHEVVWNKQKIVFCHYPMRSWHHNMNGNWHLYGHCHNTIPTYGKSFDIGVDAWNFEPQRFEEIKAEMDKHSLICPEPGFRCRDCKQFPCTCADNDNIIGT